MDQFVARFQALVIGVLSGFDRIVFRGHLLPLIRDGGMACFLSRAGIRLLDFKSFATKTTEAVKQAALAEAERLDRPIRYLESSAIDKEDLARKLLAKHPIDKGLICAFKALEPCQSFEYHRDPDPSKRGLKLRPKKCLHIYHYYRHPEFGFMHVRLQTWFPFNVQIYLNGREWLTRQLDRAGVRFTRHDNCLTWVQDIEKAQQLLYKQLDTHWPDVLTRLARSLNPLHEEIFAPYPMDYYWSAYQTEWATDILFKDAGSLAAVYGPLVQHAMKHFHSPDVVRFLGKEKLHANFAGEVDTSFKHRPEGVRVKHYVAGNSIKMYDKAGSVLRVETTIGNPAPFKVYRPEDDERPTRKLAWRPLRKGIADIHRRAHVSQVANENYLDALAAVNDDTLAGAIFDQVSKPTTYRGRRVRALRIGDQDDVALLEAIARGEWATAGFRNRDLRTLLYPSKRLATVEQARRLSARVSRKLRLLRAHGVIHKIPKSHRYRLSPKGHLLTAAVAASRAATIKNLGAMAA